MDGAGDRGQEGLQCQSTEGWCMLLKIYRVYIRWAERSHLLLIIYHLQPSCQSLQDFVIFVLISDFITSYRWEFVPFPVIPLIILYVKQFQIILAKDATHKPIWPWFFQHLRQQLCWRWLSLDLSCYWKGFDDFSWRSTKLLHVLNLRRFPRRAPGKCLFRAPAQVWSLLNVRYRHIFAPLLDTGFTGMEWIWFNCHSCTITNFWRDWIPF